MKIEDIDLAGLFLQARRNVELGEIKDAIMLQQQRAAADAEEDRQRTHEEDERRHIAFEFQTRVRPAIIATIATDRLRGFLVLDHQRRHVRYYLDPKLARSLQDKEAFDRIASDFDNLYIETLAGWSVAAGAAVIEIANDTPRIRLQIKATRPLDLKNISGVAKRALSSDAGLKFLEESVYALGGDVPASGEIERQLEDVLSQKIIKDNGGLAQLRVALLQSLDRVDQLLQNIPGATSDSLPWKAEYEFARRDVVAPVQRMIFTLKCLAFLAKSDRGFTPLRRDVLLALGASYALPADLAKQIIDQTDRIMPREFHGKQEHAVALITTLCAFARIEGKIGQAKEKTIQKLAAALGVPADLCRELMCNDAAKLGIRAFDSQAANRYFGAVRDLPAGVHRPETPEGRAVKSFFAIPDDETTLLVFKKGDTRIEDCGALTIKYLHLWFSVGKKKIPLDDIVRCELKFVGTVIHVRGRASEIGSKHKYPFVQLCVDGIQRSTKLC